MRTHPSGMTFGFGSDFTALGKRMLMIYGIVYIVELILVHWIHMPSIGLLFLYPYDSSNFHIFQLVTHHFLHDPLRPFGFLIDCLVFYFFAGQVEKALGSKRFLTLFYGSALCGALFGLLTGGLFDMGGPFMGMLPAVISLIVVFGLLTPEATIYLMFIIPIKAKYISYGTILIVFFTFLAKVNPHAGYHLGGILFGYTYMHVSNGTFNFQLLRFKFTEWRIKQKKSRFTVIDGNKDKNDKKNKPTYH